MALAASPPPSLSNKSLSETTSDTALDEEIATVRAEIQALTKRRKLLASTLLSSTTVQTRLSQLRTDNTVEVTPILAASKTHSQANIHRLAFGITSFPFQDPSPEVQEKNPLLGIRIDICDRTGRFDKPYYIFCIRTGTSPGNGNGNGDETSQDLRIHRHTIPALVPLQDYEKRYLPLPDEGYGSSEDSMVLGEAVAQDLHGLAERVRDDLVAWRLRQEAIELLREELEIPEPVAKGRSGDKGEYSEDRGDEENDDEDHDEEDDDESSPEMVGLFSVRELSSVSVDAHQVRIVWTDGRVGRLRITSQGRIEKAVVIGLNERLRDQERILMDRNPMLRDLGERLERVDSLSVHRNTNISRKKRRRSEG